MRTEIKYYFLEGNCTLKSKKGQYSPNEAD